MSIVHSSYSNLKLKDVSSEVQVCYPNMDGRRTTRGVEGSARWATESIKTEREHQDVKSLPCKPFDLSSEIHKMGLYNLCIPAMNMLTLKEKE